MALTELGQQALQEACNGGLCEWDSVIISRIQVGNANTDNFNLVNEIKAVRRLDGQIGNPYCLYSKETNPMECYEAALRHNRRAAPPPGLRQIHLTCGRIRALSLYNSPIRTPFYAQNNGPECQVLDDKRRVVTEVSLSDGLGHLFGRYSWEMAVDRTSGQYGPMAVMYIGSYVVLPGGAGYDSVILIQNAKVVSNPLVPLIFKQHTTPTMSKVATYSKKTRPLTPAATTLGNQASQIPPDLGAATASAAAANSGIATSSESDSTPTTQLHELHPAVPRTPCLLRKRLLAYWSDGELMMVTELANVLCRPPAPETFANVTRS